MIKIKLKDWIIGLLISILISNLISLLMCRSKYKDLINILLQITILLSFFMPVIGDVKFHDINYYELELENKMNQAETKIANSVNLKLNSILCEKIASELANIGIFIEANEIKCSISSDELNIALPSKFKDSFNVIRKKLSSSLKININLIVE